MRTATESLVGVTDVSRHTSKFIDRAESGERLVILRNNKPAAIIIDVETANRLHKIEEMEEDLRLLVASLVRMTTDSGRRFELEEVAAEFGIDLDSDEME